MKDLRRLLETTPSVYIVYDRNVEQYLQDIAPGRPSFAIDATEQTKNLQTVENICRFLLENGAGRESLLVGIGGGITTDIAGFAASVYKRGIRYATVPTTLLAMVDASIGGKTGVNLDGYKNILGKFVQTQFNCVCPTFLQTLPEREFRAGSAEMLKAFIIEDRANYEKAVKVLSKEVPTVGEVAPLIRAAVDIKERIVLRDPYEHGRRRVLNLGHTIAHAIEWRQSLQPRHETDFSHGQAVAIGIIWTARRSEALHLAHPGIAERLEADFKSCCLPTQLPFPAADLRQAGFKDKKVEQGLIYEPFIRKIGKVDIQKTSIEDLFSEE